MWHERHGLTNLARPIHSSKTMLCMSNVDSVVSLAGHATSSRRHFMPTSLSQPFVRVPSYRSCDALGPGSRRYASAHADPTAGAFIALV